MKYQWKSAVLKKKANNYTWLMIASMLFALAILYLAAEAYKVYNLIFVALAIVFWVLSYRTQSQDKKLRKDKG